jgi:hypothetical protein
VITALLLLITMADQQTAARVINCPQIYGGKKLEKSSDLVVDGTANFTYDRPTITVRRTIKGAKMKVVPISTRSAGEDTIWFCPDFWKPTRKIEKGRFYLEKDSDTEFRIKYAETR